MVVVSEGRSGRRQGDIGGGCSVILMNVIGICGWADSHCGGGGTIERGGSLLALLGLFKLALFKADFIEAA